ncbi:PREDICTED: translation factor GUF1, mitochondrial [Amphimedon queenslandica]|uniref:Translation factor GUF1 homolog, mitochondrial n=1 Tax=Amphimedon queenslandica TaxID=400682 RepID=A0A1X7VLJ5_AMPQE|nr:PREDICTED: translation factor GUF1, mitochondrial [Amphimedon queenslandica]|eukprot:XP_019864391.1 PREDICTED: translation factor GUF1, mitochondrial [Amphimedon queenslandica]
MWRVVPKRSFILSPSVVRLLSDAPIALQCEKGGGVGGEIGTDNIRNFGIVAHVDHGKSTLADRLLELTGTVRASPDNKQLLDRLPVERERGITVKAQTATMLYSNHMLNLIDTPGHVDFSYEVSRSLSACDGVILLVDARQGVKAQTVANYLLAADAGLTVIPAVNKIDLHNADVPETISQMCVGFGFEEDEIHKISAKLGTGVPDLLNTVISNIPPPAGRPDSPLRLLLFDSWYDKYRGVVCVVTVRDGKVSRGDLVTSIHSSKKYEVADLGLLRPQQVPQNSLSTGQVGYVILGMKDSREALIGDTICHTKCYSKVEPLPGLKPAKPMVFAGVYPMDQSEYTGLRASIERLILNDSSVSSQRDTSVALGQGWRLGFLGLLHMDVFIQRLEEEFNASVLLTTPSVPYQALMRDGSILQILNPSHFPDKNKVTEFREPIVKGTLIFPDQYLGKLLALCEERRGDQQQLVYLTSSRVMLKYILPLSEVVFDFFDQVKSISSGYASFDYEDAGYQKTKLVKLDILLNGQQVDALSCVVHADSAYSIGRSICSKLKDTIRRQLFEVAVQAAVGGRVIARESVKALRKDVTAKCYGGDITRKMKLLRQQREGKKRLKRIGNVELDRDAFLSVLKKDKK